MTDADRKQEALASVRRLMRTGGNKSFWQRRERELSDEITALQATPSIDPGLSGKEK